MFAYALALEDHGRDAVLERVGVEPSGDAFNSITFDERNRRPQCAITITCADLAVMAATLANGCTNPLTREQVLSRHVLTVLATACAG